MKNKLLYKLRSGKNPKFIYYSVNALRLVIPKGIFRLRLQGKLSSLSRRKDKDYIERRVDYYNKLSGTVQLPSSAPHLSEHKMSKQKVYFFDTYQYTRWFSDQFQWGFCPGDVTFVPDYPSIVKSRPLTDDNANSIVMKLDKVRHFIFVEDKKAFTEKKNMVIFRGKVKGKPSRKLFMEMYFHHPMCDLGDVSKNTTDPAEWRTEKKTINEHLDYKFIMALEGIDVFDEVFLSYAMRKEKPSVEIYEEMTQQTGLNPATTLYFDDRTENAEAGKRFGFQSVLVETNLLEEHQEWQEINKNIKE